ncbi:MAG TPA: SDR family NAD(P)-dependent oxidoreductase [Gemmatimonadaceae bacterium]|nr:SDR family NAD(P)-dependent oxidoreductase [Gemmatimonadaceae bacterium]
MAAATGRKGTALVTGASRGIGRAIALRLSADGYDVVAVARDQGELDSLCAEIATAGGRCRALPLDVTDGAAVSRALQGENVDVLVNNAGVGIIKPFVDMSLDEWNTMLDVNVNALYHVTHALLPKMLERGRGHVCTIGSISGRSAYVGGAAYSGTKAFVTAWAESLMLEVRGRGVKVSVVAPGGVATEFSGHTVTEADQWKLAPEDVATAVSQVIATPPDVLIHRLEVRTLTPPPAKPAK